MGELSTWTRGIAKKFRRHGPKMGASEHAARQRGDSSLGCDHGVQRTAQEREWYAMTSARIRTKNDRAWLLPLTASLGWLLSHRVTAMEWSAMDMAPWFERLASPSFASGDFFTEASQTANPRQVFGWLVAAPALLLRCDWYTVFFGLKTLLVLVQPVLFFFVLRKGLSNRRCGTRSSWLPLLTAICAVVPLWLPSQLDPVILAGWRPMTLQASPSGAALTLALAATLVGSRPWLSTALWYAAGFVHPAVGPMTWFFSVLWLGRLERWKLHTLQAASVAAGTLTVAIVLRFPGVVVWPARGQP